MSDNDFIPVTGNQWYILYPCITSDQPVTFTSATLFGAYVNEEIEVYDNVAYNYLGCFTVKLFLGTPPSGSNINNNIIYEGTRCGSCYSVCMVIGGSGIAKYLDVTGTGVEKTVSLPAKVCTYTKPYIDSSIPANINILSYECTSDTSCEITCYELTNCKTGQIIYSNNQNLFSACANQSTISLNELDGCWTLDIGADCECFEDVSINLIYPDCQACLPIVAYTLTNCENESLVKYSEEDLSLYVGKIVSLDCGDCWIVEQIDYKPPQTQEFVVENVYESCAQCSRAYFILYDCQGNLNPITTFTDMTVYGTNVLKLAGYSSCWTAFPSPDADYENAVGVTVTKQFEECQECLTVTGCKCSKLKNIIQGEARANYLDCFGEEQLIILQAGQSSQKICVNRWTFLNTTNFELTESGECVDNPNLLGSKVCPAALTGKMVKPGYTTPSCDTEKFERITCETAEILYKQVLQLRYGISNCCPEDDENMIIKKEVIDLQALNDPDYSCALSSSCCAPAQCGCGNCISQ